MIINCFLFNSAKVMKFGEKSKKKLENLRF